MADAQDILFRLKTEGDAAGAEKVTEAIQDTGEAAKETSKTLEDAAKAEQAVNDRELNLREKAVQWVKVGEQVKQYAGAIRSAVAQVDGLDASTKRLVENAAQGAEQIGSVISSVAQGFAAGGPLGAVVGAASSALSIIGSEWLKTSKQMDQAEESIRRAAEMQRRLTEMKARLPLAEAAREASALLDEVYQKALRNERIRESERSLEMTETREAGRAGVAAGTLTSGQADARNLAKELSLSGEAAVSDLQSTRQLLEKLRADAATAAQDAKELTGEDQARQLEKAKELQDQANAVAKQLADDQQIALNKMRELGSAAAGSAAEISDESLAALTEVVTKERDALKAEVDRLGANASAGAKASLQLLESILEDGTFRANEIQKYAEAQGRLNNMAEKNNKAVLDAFMEGQQLSAAFSAEIVRLRQQISDMQRDFSERLAKINTK